MPYSIPAFLRNNREKMELELLKERRDIEETQNLRLNLSSDGEGSHQGEQVQQVDILQPEVQEQLGELQHPPSPGNPIAPKLVFKF